LEKLKANVLPVLIALSALSVSGSAAFYSVSGLSKLFAGASFEVIIMASSLEISKLVIASLLYQYWDVINKWLRTYLASAVVILVLITSMGIYGFLSAAYQDMMKSLKEYQKIFQYYQMLSQLVSKLEILLLQLGLEIQSQLLNLDYHKKEYQLRKKIEKEYNLKEK
jgi:hypothetical protein